MSHHIIIDKEDLVRGASGLSGSLHGTEVVFCKDCKYGDKRFWQCNFNHFGYWDELEEADVIYRIDIDPNGYCWKGEQND